MDKSDVTTKDKNKDIIRIPTVKTVDKKLLREECISLLPEISLFIQRDPKGRILREVKGVVQLSEKAGELVTIEGKVNFTASGWRKLNHIGGVSLIQPPYCFVGSVQYPNPYIERNDKTGGIRRVTARVIGINYSAIGKAYIADKTISIDTYIYLLQNLMTKVRLIPNCGCIGTADNRPTVMFYKQIKEWQVSKEGKKIPIYSDEVHKVDVKEKPLRFFVLEGEAGLWVDLSHPEIQAVLALHIQLQKFADRIAPTCAERNCLKALIPISRMEFDPKTGIAEVEVIGWRDERTYKDIYKIAEEIDKNNELVYTSPTDDTPAYALPTDEEMIILQKEIESNEEEQDLLSGLELTK